jgi:hypothetical protein
MAFNPYLPFFVSIQTSIANFRRPNPGSQSSNATANPAQY